MHRLKWQSSLSLRTHSHAVNQACLRVISKQTDRSALSRVGSSLITLHHHHHHQLRHSSTSSSTSASSSTTKNWDQLKSEIESQQRIEQEENESDPSRQKSSDLASILRMKLAGQTLPKSTARKEEVSNLDRSGSGKEENLPRSHADEGSISNQGEASSTSTSTQQSQSQGYLFETRKEKFFTTTQAVSSELGGIFQNATIIDDRSDPRVDRVPVDEWLLLSIPSYRQDYLVRTYFNLSVGLMESAEFLRRIMELLTQPNEEGRLVFTEKARPKRVALENGKVKLEFGRLLTTNFVRQLRNMDKGLKDSLLEFTKYGNGKELLITDLDAAFAGQVEQIWEEFLEEKSRDRRDAAMKARAKKTGKVSANPPQSPPAPSRDAKLQALSASMGINERSASKGDEIEESVPVSIQAAEEKEDRPDSKGEDSLKDFGVKETAIGAGLGMEERGSTSDDIEDSRPVEIDSINDSEPSKTDSTHQTQSQAREPSLRKESTGLGMSEGSQDSSSVEESLPVQIGSNPPSPSQEGSLEDETVKESAVGAGLGARERESTSEGIEESRPVEIDPPAQDRSDTSRNTKEEALKAGMGLSERESSLESNNVEDSRPAEIEIEVKNRRSEMGLMSGKDRNKDDGNQTMEGSERGEKAIGKGLGLGSNQSEKEANVEEMTPVQIGGGEESK